MRGACAWLALAALAVGLGRAAALVQQVPLEADVPVKGSIWANETVCYVVSLDSNTTRDIVYWSQAKLFVHLQPCTGTPHLRASVHGCPSDGATVNWEYQSAQARTDLLAKGERVTPEWEWIGDIETLSIDLTHRKFYVEVSAYQPPMRTNESIGELGRRFRYLGYDNEADRIEDILFMGRVEAAEVAELRILQRILMPESSYTLSAFLHDEATFPQAQIFPMANTIDWDREVEHEKDATIVIGGDPLAGHYIISFWPPTLAGASANATSSSSSAAAESDGLAAARRRWLDELAPVHSRRVLEMRHDGPVTLEHLEQLVAEHPNLSEELAAELEHARTVFSAGDVIFDAHPGSPHAQAAGVRRQMKADDKKEKLAKVVEEKRSTALDKTNAALEKLRGVVPGFDAAAARGKARHEEYVRERDTLPDYVLRRSSETHLRVVSNETGSASVGGRSQHVITDEELEYMVYWVDITKDVRARWGVTTNSMLYEFTRLLDGEPRQGPLCSPSNPDTTKCGIKQLISRSEFTRIDKDDNGIISLSEYEAEYPPERQAYDDGFTSNYTFSKAAANNSATEGIEYGTWRNVYDGHRAIFDASVKDPLVRSYWTVCGLNVTGIPMVASGNVTKDPTRAEWLSSTGFEQLSSGKLVRTIKGLDDADNNVYILNVIVRNKVTGEQFAYKPHVLQRKFPDYEAPEAMDATGTSIVIGVGVAAGVIIGVFIGLLIFSKNKAPRPTIKVVAT